MRGPSGRRLCSRSTRAAACPSHAQCSTRDRLRARLIVQAVTVQRSTAVARLRRGTMATDAVLLHWDGSSDPTTYMSTELIPEGRPQSFGTAGVSVHIGDARAEQSPPTLHTAGFELVHAPTPLQTADFYDADTVTSTYYDECCALVSQHTGASVVLAFDHNVRSASEDLFADRSRRQPASSGQIEPDGPVHFVHNDYTDVSGPQRVHDLARPEGNYTITGRALLNSDFF
eukprot:SAG31_NODE_7730_length_1607_cov_1.777188_1_plen_230_part_00